MYYAGDPREAGHDFGIHPFGPSMGLDDGCVAEVDSIQPSYHDGEYNLETPQGNPADKSIDTTFAPEFIHREVKRSGYSCGANDNHDLVE